MNSSYQIELALSLIRFAILVLLIRLDFVIYSSFAICLTLMCEGSIHTIYHSWWSGSLYYCWSIESSWCLWFWHNRIGCSLLWPFSWWTCYSGLNQLSKCNLYICFPCLFFCLIILLFVIYSTRLRQQGRWRGEQTSIASLRCWIRWV